MIALSSKTMTLQAVLGGAVAANQPVASVAYIDMPNQTPTDVPRQIPGLFNSTLNSTTDVDICEAYSGRFATGARVIKHVKIYNQDTSSVNVIVKTDDGGTENIQIRATLGTLESLFYEDGRGWYSTDSSGAIKTAISQIPMAPLFLAYNSTTDANQTGNGATVTVEFDTEVYDVTGNYSASTDTFTAPITGKYLLTTNVSVSAVPAGSTGFVMNIVTSNRTYRYNSLFTAGTFSQESWCLAVCADMDAADTATVTLTISGGAGDTCNIIGGATLFTFFSGVRVG